MTDTAPDTSWELQAFIKLARKGAICFLPTSDGKFLMQKNHDPGPYKGKLRPPGGGAEKCDRDHFATILRELKEEFDIDPLKAKKKLKFIGYEYRKPFWGTAIFELTNHNLKPGIYQASNDPDEKVHLVEVDLDHDDYNGPQPHKLITAEAKAKGDALMKSAGLSCPACKHHFDAVKLPEIHMGAVACPKCGKACTQAHEKPAAPGVGAFSEDPTKSPMQEFADAAKRADAKPERVSFEELMLHATSPECRPVDWADRLRRLRERRGELEKSARYLTESELLAWGSDNKKEYREHLDDACNALAKPHKGGVRIKGSCGHMVRNVKCMDKLPVESLSCPCESCWKPHTKKASTEQLTADLEIVTPISEMQAWAKSAGLRVPENWDKDEKLSTKDFSVWVGANDWENSTTCVAFDFGGTTDRKRRVWAHLNIPKEILDGAHWDSNAGKDIVKRWIKLADEHRHKDANKDLPHPSWSTSDFTDTAKAMGASLKEWGLSRVMWEDMDKSAATASAIPDDAPMDTSDLPDMQSSVNRPKVDDNRPIPTTGPAAIAHALNNIDLDREEEESKSVVKRGLKTKRPLAVKKLGYIQGFRRSGLHPRDLMISRVPVIPPQFRPYSVAGDVFIPGDANELYRDLINMVGVHKDLESKLGPSGAASNKLRIYDAMRAVYGFGEPTSPKTKERGISGFLQKVTGENPKFGYVQHKLLSHNQDYVGRGVVGVDPDLGLDELGIPDEMAWKLYAPYIHRRLVRNGTPQEAAVRAVRDRTDEARKMMEDEAKERPVMYSRAPAWHRFSVLGAYPQIVKGNTIMVNPLVTTGLNMDFDGDTCNVHLPSMHEAVNDVKTKLMPSKMLWSTKEHDKTMPVTKQENLLGLFSAQQRPAKRAHVFPNEAAALAAIKRGDVAMSDEIQIENE